MEPELHDTWLRIALPSGGHGDFHYRWLRHNCDGDLHPATRERMLCSSELPDDLRAVSAVIDDDRLIVRWSHGDRESRYPLAWLVAHAYARDRAAVPIPHDVAAVTVADGDTNGALATLAEHGAAVVRRPAGRVTPAEDETEPLIDAFASAGLRVIGTHFGRIEDLRTDNVTNANTDQLGYTDAPIELHTDQPFLEQPPRYQLLQCIRPAVTGGDSYLVDARAAAEHLRSVDRAAYELLRETPVRFHRKQKGFEKILDAPLLSGDGETFQVRWSYFTLAPYRLAFERMEAWYRAHDRFARLVRAPEHQYRFSLAEGDHVLYDNFRMLHARTAFRGARWLRGVYFDAAASARL